MRGNVSERGSKRSQPGLISITTAALLLFAGLTLAAAQKKPPATPIDLNTATITQLEKLPGVGPSTAKSIIEFRNRSGPFQRVEDLLAIRGISKARLEKLRPYVTVSPSAGKQQPSGST
ncbi:MAG: helix-hairpin-helix domain-containing protein [Candidatus Acidiferrales bacterium]